MSEQQPETVGHTVDEERQKFGSAGWDATEDDSDLDIDTDTDTPRIDPDIPKPDPDQDQG